MKKRTILLHSAETGDPEMILAELRQKSPLENNGLSQNFTGFPEFLPTKTRLIERTQEPIKKVEEDDSDTVRVTRVGKKEVYKPYLIISHEDNGHKFKIVVDLINLSANINLSEKLQDRFEELKKCLERIKIFNIKTNFIRPLKVAC